MKAQPQFRRHLSQQLDFLTRSCEAFDQGHTSEAIRLATSIRVLIHQTKSSTSLLKHLGATTIPLLSTVPEISVRTISFSGMGQVHLSSDGKHEYRAPLGDTSFSRVVPVSKWWTEVILVSNGIRATRKQVVLGAANQDGGAHVDAVLDATYAEAARPGSAGHIESERAGVVLSSKPLLDTHLLSLRQMGYELLHSPALLALQGDG